MPDRLNVSIEEVFSSTVFLSRFLAVDIGDAPLRPIQKESIWSDQIHFSERSERLVLVGRISFNTKITTRLGSKLESAWNVFMCKVVLRTVRTDGFEPAT